VKLILALLILGAGPAAAYAPIQCGIPPIPPIGCTAQDAVCVCDAQGNCHWEFHCR
jgi:hypothetical protein